MKKGLTIFFAVVIALALFTIAPFHSSAAAYDPATATKTLVVYDDPGTSYKVLGKIKANTALKIYGGVSIGKDQLDLPTYKQYGWSRITYNQKSGYVKTHQLRFKYPKQWTPGVKAKVVKSLRKNGYIGEKYRTVYNGDSYYSVQVPYKGTWKYVVTANCKTGYYHG